MSGALSRRRGIITNFISVREFGFPLDSGIVATGIRLENFGDGITTIITPPNDGCEGFHAFEFVELAHRRDHRLPYQNQTLD